MNERSPMLWRHQFICGAVLRWHGVYSGLLPLSTPLKLWGWIHVKSDYCQRLLILSLGFQRASFHGLVDSSFKEHIYEFKIILGNCINVFTQCEEQQTWLINPRLECLVCAALEAVPNMLGGVWSCSSGPGQRLDTWPPATILPG